MVSADRWSSLEESAWRHPCTRRPRVAAMARPTHAEASAALARLDPTMARPGRATRPDAPAAAGAGPTGASRTWPSRSPTSSWRARRRPPSGVGSGPSTGPARSIAEEVLATPVESLRAAGLSGAKAAAVHDLARHVADGTLTARAGRAAGRRRDHEPAGAGPGDRAVDGPHVPAVHAAAPRRVADRRLRRAHRLRAWPTSWPSRRPARSSTSWASGSAPTAAWPPGTAGGCSTRPAGRA